MMLLQTWLLKRELSTLGKGCGNRLLLHYWVGTSSSRYDERNQLLADAASVVARRCVERACMRYNIGTKMDWHHVYVCQRRLNACNTEHKLVNSLFKSTVYSYSCASRKTLKPQTPDLYGTKRVLEGPNPKALYTGPAQQSNFTLIPKPNPEHQNHHKNQALAHPSKPYQPFCTL